MTLQEIIADIHAMDRELQKYENKYGLRSRYFYELYTSGKLRDEDPEESREYGDWAACYDIKHHRIPAPNLSFERPNLPFLIEEIERKLLATDCR